MVEKTFRDELAMNLDVETVKFLSLDDMARFVGLEKVPDGGDEFFTMNFDAIAKLRYMYADAMLKARGSEAVKTEEPVVDAEGWIVHDGKGIPCEGDTIVDCKFRDGKIITELCAFTWHGGEDASDSNWIHGGREYDIIAWRPAQ